MATNTAGGDGLTTAEPRAVTLAIVSAFLFGAGGLAIGVVFTLVATLVVFITIGEITPAASLVLGLVFVQGVGCGGVALAYPTIRRNVGRRVARQVFGIEEPNDRAVDRQGEDATADAPEVTEEVVSGPSSPVEASRSASVDDDPSPTETVHQQAGDDDGPEPQPGSEAARFGEGKRTIPGSGGTFSIPWGVPDLRGIGAIVGGYVAAFGGVIAVAMVVTFLIDPDTGANQAAEIGMEHPEVLLLLIPASILLIGPGEELLFRGVVQGRLREVFHPYVAILIAAAFFAGLHFFALTGGTLTGNLVALGILTVPSIVFGAVYEYTENIVVPSLVHGIYNATLFGMLYIAVTFGEGLEEEAMTLLAVLA